VAEELERPSDDLVAKAQEDRAKAKTPFAVVGLFFRQVLQELSKVTKPTRKELIRYTGVVLGFVAIAMAIIAGLDFAFFSLVSWVFGG
jgi:preprotein translocase subunit SecE